MGPTQFGRMNLKPYDPKVTSYQQCFYLNAYIHLDILIFFSDVELEYHIIIMTILPWKEKEEKKREKTRMGREKRGEKA